jgi:hypothetical protein
MKSSIGHAFIFLPALAAARSFSAQGAKTPRLPATVSPVRFCRLLSLKLMELRNQHLYALCRIPLCLQHGIRYLDSDPETWTVELVVTGGKNYRSALSGFLIDLADQEGQCSETISCRVLQ